MPALGTLTYNPDLRPTHIHHQNGKHHWMVREVLCHWESGLSAPERLSAGGTVECWRVKVYGPLLWSSSEKDEFVMTAKCRGRGPYWVLDDGTAECGCARNVAATL